MATEGERRNKGRSGPQEERGYYMTPPVTGHDIDLPRLMEYLLTAQEAALSAQVSGRLAGSHDAEKEAAAAAQAINAAIGRLQAAGVEVPTARPRAVADSFSLSSLASLASLDTSDSRSLLAGLTELLPVAERIDRERGHWFENALSTDTKGTDLAEAVYHLICRLKLELSGPRSRRGE